MKRLNASRLDKIFAKRITCRFLNTLFTREILHNGKKIAHFYDLCSFSHCNIYYESIKMFVSISDCVLNKSWDGIMLFYCCVYSFRKINHGFTTENKQNMVIVLMVTSHEPYFCYTSSLTMVLLKRWLYSW